MHQGLGHVDKAIPCNAGILVLGMDQLDGIRLFQLESRVGHQHEVSGPDIREAADALDMILGDHEQGLVVLLFLVCRWEGESRLKDVVGATLILLVELSLCRRDHALEEELGVHERVRVVGTLLLLLSKQNKTKQ